MKILLFIFLIPVSFLNADILSDRIQSKMNEVCYYKSFIDGSNDGTIPQSSFTGTESNRQLIQTITNSSTSSDIYTCDTWTTNPYVNIDSETYAVIANTSCITSTENTGSEASPETTYYRDIMQYHISVDCNSGCEFPKDEHGNVYELNTRITQSECTIDTLNRLYENNNDVYIYKIVDAEYVTCDITPSASGCYYLLGLNDTNQTTVSNDFNTTPITDGLSNLDDSINKLNKDSSSNSNKIDSAVSDLKEKLRQDDDTRRRQLDRIIEETNRTANIAGTNMLTLYDINSSLNKMNKFMHSELNNTDIKTTTEDAVTEANSTVSGITTILNGLTTSMSSYAGSLPVVTGTGNPVFTANVYGSDIVFDFSMIQNLKQYFDILWVLLLAYFNFKIYVIIIRDLMQKI